MLKGAKRFVGKSLQPARPVRHLPSKQASTITFEFQTELPSNSQVCLQSKVDWLSEMTEMKILTQNTMPRQPNQHELETKKERIKYSRDFLLELSSVSLSQKKPEFLPDHPIVLEKPVSMFFLLSEVIKKQLWRFSLAISYLLKSYLTVCKVCF
uniref:Chromosome 8 open reading frame 88 n=1 Tax=Anser brachyrhynchus TaxID=132585 RepID=A0A8B9CHK7_9AVES